MWYDSPWLERGDLLGILPEGHNTPSPLTIRDPFPSHEIHFISNTEKMNHIHVCTQVPANAQGILENMQFILQPAEGSLHTYQWLVGVDRPDVRVSFFQPQTDQQLVLPRIGLGFFTALESPWQSPSFEFFSEYLVWPNFRVDNLLNAAQTPRLRFLGRKLEVVPIDKLDSRVRDTLIEQVRENTRRIRWVSVVGVRSR